MLVLTLIDRIVKVFKKDFQLLSNYERTHPHFFWYLGIDAIISVAIIIGGYSFYTNMTTDRHALKHVGADVMTSQEVVEHASKFNVLAYWLGSMNGYEYTLNHTESDVADIFYWREGSYSHSSKQFLYEIKTYRNQQAWDSRAHNFKATTNIQTIHVDEDLTIRINPTSMRGVIATFVSKPEIVALAYPVPQKLQDMIKNVEGLRPVQ
jgi:hypothetical protein